MVSHGMDSESARSREIISPSGLGSPATSARGEPRGTAISYSSDPKLARIPALGLGLGLTLVLIALGENGDRVTLFEVISVGATAVLCPLSLCWPLIERHYKFGVAVGSIGLLLACSLAVTSPIPYWFRWHGPVPTFSLAHGAYVVTCALAVGSSLVLAAANPALRAERGRVRCARVLGSCGGFVLMLSLLAITHSPGFLESLAGRLTNPGPAAEALRLLNIVFLPLLPLYGAAAALSGTSMARWPIHVGIWIGRLLLATILVFFVSVTDEVAWLTGQSGYAGLHWIGSCTILISTSGLAVLGLRNWLRVR